MRIGKSLVGLGVALSGMSLGAAVWAQDALGKIVEGLPVIGKPTDGAMGFPPAATEVARDIHWLDGMIMWIISAITVFVVILLLIVLLRFNERVNKTPASFTHNSLVEVFWTLGPIVILIFIGAFSLPILFKQLEIPKADISINVTGNQWYWSYEYPKNNFGFDSFLLDKADLKDAGYSPDEYLLAVDAPMVVPVNKTVVLTITGSDVIHSWAVPSFGIKLDAVPGRQQKTWFKAEKEGVYFGQCSELCGKNHAYMPITVKVVSQEVYAKWLKGAIKEYAGDPQPLNIASSN